MEANNVIAKLCMIPHPEGGYYVETYRSRNQDFFSTHDARSPRNHHTAIYYMLKAGEISKFHKIKSDEVFHFYLGQPLRLVQLYPDSGEVRETVLGQDILSQGSPQVLQHVVKAGCWYGAYLDERENQTFSLIGCTVAPGFEFQDFTQGHYEDLMEEFKGNIAAEQIIEKLGW